MPGPGPSAGGTSSPDRPIRADALLGPAEIRDLAARLGVVPRKSRGQNFLHDANTVRRIVRIAAVEPGEWALEVGPGLGSLTLGLLAAGAVVTAVEIDPRMAAALPATVASHLPHASGRLGVVTADALRLGQTDLPRLLPAQPSDGPSALVSNLPYNVAVPVVLHLLRAVPTLRHGLVMVQREVADRLTAAPGSRTYGVPSVKIAWYATAVPAGPVGRHVFWPEPNVDSALVAFERHDPPGDEALRERVFALVDSAFAQRRKTLRAALSAHLGGPSRAEDALRDAGIDPRSRGEVLGLADFVRLARTVAGSGPQPPA